MKRFKGANARVHSKGAYHSAKVLSAWLMVLSLALPAHADISSFNNIPKQVDNLNKAASQGQSEFLMMQIQAQSGGMSRGRTMEGLSLFDDFYQKQMDHVEDQVDDKIDAVLEVTKSLSTQMHDDVFTSCLDLDKNDSLKRDWRKFENALNNLKDRANESFKLEANDGFQKNTSQTMSDNVRNDFHTIAENLTTDGQGIFDRIRSKCCPGIDADKRKQMNLCSSSYIDEELAKLNNIKPVNAKFVDPFALAARYQINPQTLVAMASLGRLDDFFDASDFNSQQAALAGAATKCNDDAKNLQDSILNKAQMAGVFQNVMATAHCSAWALAANGNKTVRDLVLGWTNTPMQLFTMTSQCPPQVQAQAASLLSFGMPQFAQDVGRYFSLPPDIHYTMPVSNPFVLNNFGADGMSISMLGQGAGGSVANMFLPGTNSYTNLQPIQSGLNVSSLSTPVTNGRQTTTVGTTTTSPGSSIRGLASVASRTNAVSPFVLSTGPRGLSVIDNVSGNSKAARLAVRGIASKIMAGDAESARTLANNVAAKVSDLRARVSNMSSDSAAKSRSLLRAATSRSLVEKFTAIDAAVKTADNMSVLNLTMAKAVGLRYTTSAIRGGGPSTSDSTSGRSVTTVTPTISTTTAATNPLSGTPQSNVVSNLGGSYSITQAQTAINAQRTGITNTMNQVALQGAALAPIYSSINNLIAQKNQAIQHFYLDMDPAKWFTILNNDGADKRISDESKIASEYEKDVMAIHSLDTQIIGLQSMAMFQQNSIVNNIRVGQAFSGMQVDYADGATNTTIPGMTMNGLQASNPYGQQISPYGSPTSPYGTPISPTQSPFLVNGQGSPLLGVGLPGTNGLQNTLPGTLPGGLPTPPSLVLPNVVGSLNPLWNIFEQILPSAYASVDRTQAIQLAFAKYLTEYDAYVEKLRDERFEVQQKMWAQYVKHEEESHDEAILPVPYRNELIAYWQTLKEEIPDLREARQHKTISTNNQQIYNYIADIEKSSNEMRDLLAKEALYSWQAKSKDPMDDGDVWAGMLPAMALQP